MARLTHEPITPRRSVSNPNSLTDLNRLLARLQQSILHADAERERRLRSSQYERNRVGTLANTGLVPIAQQNLEYARTLLTKLEQDALGVKVHARRKDMQADLDRKRDVFERVSERLRELEDAAIDSDDDSSDGEDLLGAVATPSQSQSSDSNHQRDDFGSIAEEEGEEEEDADQTVLPEPRRQSTTAPTYNSSEAPRASGTDLDRYTTTTTSQTLRTRNTSTSSQPIADTASSSALRNELFAGARPKATTTTASTTDLATTTTTTAEAVLDLQRAEQDRLTESMVGMARALKESTHRFSSALAEDDEVLAAAGQGLDASERGMVTVSGRLGSLRRLTEGEGWWGRMLLYLWIAGLAVVALVLVFVLPKLRF
ncbi:Uu.00g001830.m01.CDS01 [Anthostomella pinea]|uniref:Uu.00g001830.m01.CDS01 n=1 Tax=Anthostomella pinea TaxID=933095 RepID=A0AAI8VJD1_9PEZI|nr:Uu.00g001830.m01.CDS01 [Anthostomella pinea]